MRLPWITTVALATIAAHAAAAAPDWIVEQPANGAEFAADAYFDIDWRGGTAFDYYSGIAEAFSDRANVIVRDSARGVEVEAFSVESVPPQDALLIPMRMDSRLVVDGLDDGGKVFALNKSERKTTIVISAIAVGEQGVAGGGRFDLSFPGGSIDEYVDALREQRPDANIVLMPGAGAFPAPPVNLSNVSLGAAVSVLAQQTRMRPEGQQELDVDAINDGARALYRIRIVGAVEPPARTQVWSVARIVESDMSASDLLTAVETALSLFDTPARVKYHEQTRLLLLRASVEQLRTVEQVLEEAAGSADVRAATDHARREQLRELRMERASLAADREIALAELEFAMKEMALTEDAREPQDITRAEIEIRKRRARAGEIERRLELLEERIRELSAGSPPSNSDSTDEE